MKAPKTAFLRSDLGCWHPARREGRRQAHDQEDEASQSACGESPRSIMGIERFGTKVSLRSSSSFLCTKIANCELQGLQRSREPHREARIQGRSPTGGSWPSQRSQTVTASEEREPRAQITRNEGEKGGRESLMTRTQRMTGSNS